MSQAAIPLIIKGIAAVAAAGSAVAQIKQANKKPEAPVAVAQAPAIAEPTTSDAAAPRATIEEQSAKLRTIKRRRAATRRGKLASQQDSSPTKLLGG